MSKLHPELQNHAAASTATSRTALEGDCKNQLDVIYHAKVMEPEGDPREYVGSSVNFKKLWPHKLLQKLRLQAQHHTVHIHI